MTDQPNPSRSVPQMVSEALTSVRAGLVRLGPAVNGIIRVTGEVLRFARRWTLRFLLVGMILLPLVVILGLLLFEEWRPDVRVAATSLWVALSIVIAGGAWGLFWILLRLFIRLVRSPLLGSGVLPRLAALVIVFALFPKIISPTIAGVAWSVVQFGLATPINLVRLSGNALEASEPAGPVEQAPPVSQSPATFDDTFVFGVFGRFLGTLDKTVSPLVATLPERIPFNDLAFAVATWFFLALLGREAVAQGIVSRALPPLYALTGRLGELLRLSADRISRYPSLNWSNIGFLLILTAGTFLSMAAITSLPRLRESSQPNADVNADALRRDLSELQLLDAEIASYYGADIPSEIVMFPSDQSRSAQARLDTNNKTALDTSKAGTTPVTESPDAANKSAPSTSDPSDGGKTLAIVKEDGVKDSAIAEDVGTKGAEGAELASLLAAAKVKLAAATEDQERARTDFFNDDFANENRSRELERQLNAARNREQAAFEEVQILNYQIQLSGLIEQQGSTVQAEWSGLVLRSQSLKEFIRSDESQSLSSAVREYSVQNIERRGSREETAHFLRIRNWYADKINSHRRALRLCGERLRSGRSAGATWMLAMRRTLVRADTLADAYQRSTAVYEQTNAVNGLLADEACEIPVAPPIPGPPPLGDSLGPLRFIAGWLLNAASLPLALIVGLVGFGLLGAAISTFVREQLEARLTSEPAEERHVIVSDLAGVALRGISAAIVVFLAVQGGLAVLAGAGTDPNPYVLLLACFVAAVFSERVWQKAYDYLRVQLNADGEVKRPAVEVTDAKPLLLPAESKSQE